MKKAFIILAMAFAFCLQTSAQSAYSRQGNTFTQVTKQRASAEPEQTKYTWQDSRGNTYPIYISASGSCFVIRVSKKTGKEYRQYLGKEISAQICKELGREYRSK